LGIYRELAEVMVRRQIEVFGTDRVVPALRLHGFDIDDDGSLGKANDRNEQRLYRRIGIALTRHLGALAMATAKTALANYCIERNLPTSKFINEL